MFGIILFCWAGTVLYFNPRILALLIGPENVIAKLAIIAFTLLLDLFWFYGFYHLVIVIFSYLKNTKIPYKKLKDYSIAQARPSVALFYAACNDFQEQAVLSCLCQDYSNFHTFILDDGNDEEHKQKINKFAAQYKEDVTIIRRNTRQGYKAGNINNALRRISGFDYFSISDADTILPKNYIVGLLPYFRNDKTAFVQSRQKSNPLQRTEFAEELGFQIDLHCERYLKTKNKYGFVMFYGHGALMRADICKQIGGFPEVATEDLAYSMKIREKGFEGVYAENICCLEDYPPTYQQYRKRNEKWVRGTTECLLKFYPSFLKSKQISWIEKFDVAASALTLLLGFPFVVLLFLVGIVLPFYFYNFQFQGPMFRMPVMFDSALLKLIAGVSGNLFWTWDFFILLLISIIAPILPAILEMRKRPRERLRYIVMYSFLFYSMQVVSSLSLIAYLITRKASFPVTGDNREYVNEKKPENFKQVIIEPIANKKFTFFIEAIIAVLFFRISLTTENIWFLSFCLGLIGSIMLFKLGYKSRIARFIVAAPLIIMAVIIIFIGKAIQ
ncbi:MAG: glycosyltransferase [Candidatus Omnitrophica bacterium]|nr:glycosyltransferase [Candidatus Omnitrophota bacterium]